MKKMGMQFLCIRPLPQLFNIYGKRKSVGVKVWGQSEKALFKWYGIVSFCLINYILKPSFTS